MRLEARSLILSLAACVLAPSFAQNAIEGECQHGNQHQLNECAYSQLEKSDAEMNRLYIEQISYLNKANKERLRASQRAWIVYRDKACHYEARSRAESGSIWLMQNSLCLESFTRARTQVLKAYVECRYNGCPE